MTGDINALGAFLLCETPEPVGSKAVVTLYFPHLPAPIVVDCTVVHTRPLALARAATGFGVRFEPATAALGLRLAQAFTSEPLRDDEEAAHDRIRMAPESYK